MKSGGILLWAALAVTMVLAADSYMGAAQARESADAYRFLWLTAQDRCEARGIEPLRAVRITSVGGR